ncbi:MAG: DUF2585 family protein [Bryobacterales bacterium]
MLTRLLRDRRLGYGLAAAATVASAVALTAMGRSLWCACGSLAPWAGDVWSRHNSQHLLDPYSFSHVLHGLLFYAAARALVGDRRLDLRFALAVAAEAAWEIAENTNAVIERYREATISLDYYGDSVANSVADIGCCALGFFVARRLPWWGSALLFVATEAVLALWIRDGLVLNVIMLLAPNEAIRAWQAGG